MTVCDVSDSAALLHNRVVRCVGPMVNARKLLSAFLDDSSDDAFSEEEEEHHADLLDAPQLLLLMLGAVPTGSSQSSCASGAG